MSLSTGKLTGAIKDCYCFTWIIDNYCACEKCNAGSILKSPEFRTGTDKENVWVLELTKYTIPLLHLQLKDCRKTLTVDVKVYISGLKNAKFVTKKYTWTFNKSTRQEFTVTFSSLSRLVSNSCKYLPGKRLTISVEIVNENEKQVPNKNNVSHNFKTLLQNKKNSDLSLVLPHKTFHVHKIMLISQSPVFSAMFDHEMKEKQMNIIEINDIDPEVMQEVLHYIYTGKVENIKDLADRILVAADKGKKRKKKKKEKKPLEGLKSMCEEALIDNLTTDNAFIILKLADIYKNKNLKEETLHFIGQHAQEMGKMTGLKTILDSHQHLLEEIFLAMRKTKTI